MNPQVDGGQDVTMIIGKPGNSISKLRQNFGKEAAF